MDISTPATLDQLRKKILEQEFRLVLQNCRGEVEGALRQEFVFQLKQTPTTAYAYMTKAQGFDELPVGAKHGILELLGHEYSKFWDVEVYAFELRLSRKS